MKNAKETIKEATVLMTTKAEVNCPGCDFSFDVFDVDVEIYNKLCQINESILEGKDVSYYGIIQEHLVVSCPGCEKEICISTIK